ncbi:response regulator [Kitasatospora sp. NPDC056184]|uniref:response regulator n=1 Tax=Kitasatospora sp. NPDC056184 TaxID=3345738 RepID=UPI0035E120C1
MTIRVVLADDEVLVRDAFRALIDGDPGLAVVGEAGSGDQAVRLARELRPDVVLMDIRMPVLDGISATRQILAQDDAGPVRVMLLTTFDLDEYAFEGLRAGAAGFLLKDTPPRELLSAVRVLASGEALLSPRVTRRLIEEYLTGPTVPAGAEERLESVTVREREVLHLIARGLSNLEIAGLLNLTTGTVKTHVSRLLMKLDARDRTQLVIAAYETGLADAHRRGR